MTPDTPRGVAERLVRLEQTMAEHQAEIARIQSEVTTNTEMIRALAPLVSQLATVAEAQRHLKDSVIDLKHEWRDDVKHFDDEIEKIVAGQEREQRDARGYRHALTVAISGAVLSPVVTVAVTFVLTTP